MVKDTKTNLNINTDSTISWKNIEQWFNDFHNFEHFKKFMRGQTVTENGVYVWDFHNYIAGERNITD